MKRIQGLRPRPGHQHGHRHCSGSRRGAFTLIEILVVVAIIALLISILLPSLNQAREQAKVAKCVANLKSLATATSGYLTSNRNRFPWWPGKGVRHRANGGTYDDYFVAYSNYFGGKRGIGDPGGDLDIYYKQNAEYDFLASERPLNRYITSAKLGTNADLPIFSCPSERPGYGGGIASRSTFGVKRSKTSAYDACGTSYQSNVTWAAYLASATAGEGLARGTVRNARLATLFDRIIPIFEKLGPSRAIMLHEDPSDCALGGVLNDYPKDWKVPGWHHKPGRHSMSFLDGHAGHVQIEAKWNLDHTTKSGGFQECAAGAPGCVQGSSGWIARHNYKQE